MPVAKLYTHGLTIGTPPRVPNRNPPLRSSVGGWSSGSVRRNTGFLRSVQEKQLPGVGLTFTLTVRDCPPDAQEFHRMRRAFLKRMDRAGVTCLHWVVEWQRRGVPHLHGIAYAPDYGPLPLHSWASEIAAPYGAAPQGQHFAPVHDVVGWLQYLAKHASRGVQHYQRSPENVPAEWRGKTGRVWGHVGNWPLRPPIRIEFANGTSWPLRRLVRAWRVADARSSGDPARIRSARQMLRCHDRNQSSVRGISEWIPPRIYDRFLEALHRDGHTIEHG